MRLSGRWTLSGLPKSRAYACMSHQSCDARRNARYQHESMCHLKMDDSAVNIVPSQLDRVVLLAVAWQQGWYAEPFCGETRRWLEFSPPAVEAIAQPVGPVSMQPLSAS
eukprot:jgi/Chlat1/8080/Chrsp75S07541